MSFLFQWCDHFHLHPGIQFCRLTVSFRESRPDVIYLMGVEVKTGRGRYRHTNIVTLSPHYQLYNRSSYNLQFAQKYFATTLVGIFSFSSHYLTESHDAESFQFSLFRVILELRPHTSQLFPTATCPSTGHGRRKNNCFV